MSGLWVTVPTTWKLQDVQAGLNVVVTILSFLGSFVFIRICWQRAARRIVKGSAVPLASLLSVSNPGEALDVVLLLHKKLVKSRYLALFIQCLVVIALSATAILSGPIARYSSRYSVLLRESPSIGSMTTVFGGVELDAVDANLTFTRLENATFPQDQLLDWLPDRTIDWSYNPSQWNNTWQMSCRKTPKTTVTVVTTGNCSSLYAEIPSLPTLTDASNFDDTSITLDTWLDTGYVKDAMIFSMSNGYGNWSRTKEAAARSMTIGLTVVHMHGAKEGIKNSTQHCSFGTGLVPSAEYTQAECNLTRKGPIANYATFTTPEFASTSNLAGAFMRYAGPKFTKESLSNTPITVPDPDFLIRFYQMYIALKDTQLAKPTYRSLDVRVTVVQISTIFLVLTSLLALFTLTGLLHYSLFLYRHSEKAFEVPQSKLDWMMQSIEAEDRPHVDSQGRIRQSATVDSIAPNTPLPHATRKKKEFEGANFGERETTTWFLRHDGPRLHSPGGPSPSVNTKSPSSVNTRESAGGSYQQQSGYYGQPETRTPGDFYSNLESIDTQYNRPSRLKKTVITGGAYPLRSLAGYQYLDSNGQGHGGGNGMGSNQPWSQDNHIVR